MRIFVPSYNRPTTHTTPALLLGAGVTDFKVVVRPSQLLDYAQHLPRKNLLALPNEGGLNVAREFTRSLLKKNEWCLQMDDNVRGFIMPEKSFYRTYDEVPLRPSEEMVTRARWQKKMNEEHSFSWFYEKVILDTEREADKRGAYLAGFSAHENPAFRFRKWTDVGYVCGKVMLMRNQGLSWNQSTESSGEDYALTAAHLFENGRVLINKWGYPMRVHYQPGGCGPYLKRLPAMQRAQVELMGRYGNLFAAKNANDPERKQGELRLRFNSLKQVHQWRHDFDGDPNVRTITDSNKRRRKR